MVYFRHMKNTKKIMFFLSIFFVLINSAYSINLETSAKGVKVDSDVLTEVESGDVDVIVTLKDLPDKKPVILSDKDEEQRKKDIKKLQKNILKKIKTQSFQAGL